MDFASTNFLTELLKFFQNHSVMGMIALQPYATELICVLAIIDLCTTWTLYDGEMRMSAMTSKVIKVGFFLFLIFYWDKINSAILVSFQYAGITAAGITDVSGDWISPSGLLTEGFDTVEKLLAAFNEISIMDDGGLGKCLMYLISAVITLAAFFFMALQILITKIEFNVFASIGVILLPFGAVRYTAFLFQRVVSAVFSFGIKLMVMYFLLGIFHTLGGDVLKQIPVGVDFSTMLRYALTYATLAFLLWQLPNLAASMMNGQPSMDAGAAIGAAKTAGVAAAAIATGGVGGAITKAASTYGNYKATMNAAKMGSYQNGGSTGGEFAKTIARQKFANSSIGKALMRGANNAITRNEDYENLKSGNAFKERQRNRNNY